MDAVTVPPAVTPETTSPAAPLKEQSRTSRLFGLILALPALLLGFLSITLPILYTIFLSLQEYDGISAPTFIGLQNYSDLFADPVFLAALSTTLRSGGLLLLITGLAAAFVSLGAGWLGKRARLVARLLFCLPLAAFVPFFWGESWHSGLAPATPLGGLAIALFGRSPILDREAAPLLLTIAMALIGFGLASGLSAMFYLSAVRSGLENRGRQILVCAVIWFTGLLASAALLAQDLLLTTVISGSGTVPASTVSYLIYRSMFALMQFGQGAAISTLLIALAVVLGIIATILIAGSGVKLRLVSTVEGEPRRSRLAPVLLILGLLGLIPLSLLGLLPATSALIVSISGLKHLGEFPNLQLALLNSLRQLLPVLVVQLPIVYLAALGIGGLRPLGKHSEWLLILFGGGLFLTLTPLLGAGFAFVRLVQGLGTLPGLWIGGLVLNTPMLFILTLFFKGQYPAWREMVTGGESPVSAAFKIMILPSLPLALLLALASAAVTINDFAWPLVVNNSTSFMPLSVFLLQLRQIMATPAAFFSVVTSVSLAAMAILLIILVAYQFLYLDRIEIQ